MSNVLQLPVFDDADNAVIVESEPLELEVVDTDAEDLEIGMPVELGADDEDHWEPEPEEVMAPEMDMPETSNAPATEEPNEQLKAAERLLEELAGAASILQLEVAARVEEIVQGMTAALFPKLAEDFLAEEISRFLAYAVPRDALRVDVLVPSPLEADLSDCVSRNKILQDFCVVQALQSEADPVVRANWGEGGFEYDLTSLLAACHARTFQNGKELEE